MRTPEELIADWRRRGDVCRNARVYGEAAVYAICADELSALAAPSQTPPSVGTGCLHYVRTWFRMGTLEQPTECWRCDACGVQGVKVATPDPQTAIREQVEQLFDVAIQGQMGRERGYSRVDSTGIFEARNATSALLALKGDVLQALCAETPQIESKK